MRELRERFRKRLAHQLSGVICGLGNNTPLALPVRCQAQELAILCLIPRWAEIAYFIDQNPQVILILPEDGETEKGEMPAWTQVVGLAEIVVAEMWSHAAGPESDALDDLYRVFRVTPRRMDRFAPAAGWGVRETLEL